LAINYWDGFLFATALPSQLQYDFREQHPQFTFLLEGPVLLNEGLKHHAYAPLLNVKCVAVP